MIASKKGVMFKGLLICVVCMDVVTLVSGFFIRNKKVGRLGSYLSWIICFMEAVGGVLGF
jgi:hypothetical protein